MGRAISCTRASRGFASSLKECPERIGCSQISSRSRGAPTTSARPAIRRRAARTARIPHMARRLPVRVGMVRARGDPACELQPDLLVNPADWVVLLGTMLGIAAYGSWRTRHVGSLNTYLRGSQSIGWGAISLVVMCPDAR